MDDSNKVPALVSLTVLRVEQLMQWKQNPQEFYLYKKCKGTTQSKISGNVMFFPL